MLNKKKCFIDFDGTIVCNKRRLYKFFLNNIEKKYEEVFTEDEFWTLKRLGVNEIDWINSKFCESISKKNWNDKKIKLIETEEYLKYDRLFSYSKQALEKLSEDYQLILISRRSNASGLLSQLEELEIKNLLDEILIVPHDNQTKAEFILRNNIKVGNEDIFIGDTEDDIDSGIALGVKVFFVKSGIRSNWIIKVNNKYKNVIIVKTINEVIDY